MEQLLHYCWKHKIFPLAALRTVDGEPLEVIHPGSHNTDAGPDFLGARVRIGGEVWAGNVEIHVRASDWLRHQHGKDAAYDSVVLHVVGVDDMRIVRNGTEHELLPQLVLPVPEQLRQQADTLLRSDVRPRCAGVLPQLPRIEVGTWLSALHVERLEERTAELMALREACGKDWEAVLFARLARYFGFGINGDAFARWAAALPLGAVSKHRDNLTQVEAFFFGQAGLLDGETPQEERSDYEAQLMAEYRFLAHKFALTPIPRTAWKFLRLRPQNFPHIRIAQLAMLWHEGNVTMSRCIGAPSVDALRGLLSTHVSEFWQSHYTFRPSASRRQDKRLSPASVDVLITNAVAPVVFAYGRYTGQEELCARAADWLEQLPAEDNRVVRDWRQADVTLRSAADTQAVLQLNKRYCEPGNCLRCRFGSAYIRQTPGFLREEEQQP
jgi:hypothetical protein